MKNIKNNFFTLAFLLVTGLLMVSPVKAQTQANDGNLICQIFPFLNNIQAFNVSSVCYGGGALPSKDSLADQAINLARLGASLIFVAIIVIAVYIVIKAALKYIRSEGDEGKIAEAQKSIKSVFVGLIALFIGIIGLVLILVLFDATTALQDTPSVETIQDATTNQ